MRIVAGVLGLLLLAASPLGAREPSRGRKEKPGGEKAPAKPSKMKVHDLGALDVEGKLKTPQLLYFLNRVKIELDTTAGEKRSFVPELERTAEDKSL